MNRNILRTVVLIVFLSNVVIAFQINNKFTAARKFFNVDISKLNNKPTVKKVQSTGFQKLIDIIKSIRPVSRSIAKSNFNLAPGQNKISISQILDFQKLNENSGRSARIWWNEDNGTPIFIDRKSAKPENFFKLNLSLNAKKYIASNFLNQYKYLLKLERPDEELILNSMDIEDNGTTHLRYFQQYKGIKVWGKDLYVHIDGNGYIESINGRYEPTPVEINDTAFKVSKEDALVSVKKDLKLRERIYEEKEPERIIYFDRYSIPHLAWFIEIRPDVSEDYYYFIDAINGNIIHKYNNTKYDGPTTGRGVDLLNQSRDLNIFQYGQTYYMFNMSKSMYDPQQSQIPYDIRGGIVVLDAKNQGISQNMQLFFASSYSNEQWNPNHVSLAYWGSILYDYYKEVHNRNSIDDKGITTYFTANVGNKFDNAFWNGYGCFFGNGDSIHRKDWAGGLDMVGHEYGHGVVQYTANLIYENQSGALNETFADWSGTMAEFYLEEGYGDWMIGEDITMIPGKCIRDIEDPGSNRGSIQQPSEMSEYKEFDISQDNGGVHYNCGITNRAFYLISQTIGRREMEKVMYRVLTKYLTQGSKFIDFRLAVIQATSDLYPLNVSGVRGLFDYLKIYDGNPTKPPDPEPPVSGKDFILFVGNNDKLLYKAKTNIPISNGDISNIEYRITIDNKPSVCEDGSIAGFVGSDKNIYLVDIVRGTLYQITNDSKWQSVSISPKADFVAVIPNPEVEIQKIYIIDVVNNTSESRTLYTQTDGTGKQNFAIYSDVVDWSIDGEYLIYDCYNLQILQGGFRKDFWDINLMKRDNGVITRIFPPLSEGVHVGNPSFSNTKYNVIAFDIFDSTDPGNPTVYVSSYDLFTGKLGLINVNSNWIGYPGFSPDDKKVIFQTGNSDGFSTNLSQISLKQDGLTGDPATLQLFIQNATLPEWYAVGPRVAVDDPEVTPSNYELYCNYPNPFNASTIIKYYLPGQDFVKLEIYNLLGERVISLFEGSQTSGYHSMVWSANDVGSGIYFCRLITPNFQKTIKLLLSK
jgi:Zn-dependent metalloprotease